MPTIEVICEIKLDLKSTDYCGSYVVLGLVWCDVV
jgi:hypothetical protein